MVLEDTFSQLKSVLPDSDENLSVWKTSRDTLSNLLAIAIATALFYSSLHLKTPS